MDMDNYVDVATRLRMAHEKYPDLRVQEIGHQFDTVDGQTILMVTVSVWRSEDDTKPAVATATEPYPGRTPYTRGSEYMVGATSALGRCLVYMGFGTRAIASADEVNAARHRFPDDSPANPVEYSPEPVGKLHVPNQWATTPKNKAPTPKQLGKLRALGFTGPEPPTSVAASRLIESLLRANGETAGEDNA